MTPDSNSVKSTNYSKYYTLLLLWIVYISNQWCRYVLNYLYAIDSNDPKLSIASACGLNSTQYGFLTGYGFSATFVVSGLFMGRAADGYNRRNIIVAGCMLWSLALFAMGQSSNFTSLLIFRLLLGIGESFSNPSSFSLIADIFPPEDRPNANGLYASAVYIGGGLASLSEALGLSIGWRGVMSVASSVGGAVALLFLATVTEPKRQSSLAVKVRLFTFGFSEALYSIKV
jgi:MFS family permease